MALHTTHTGHSLHDTLGEEIRRARARSYARQPADVRSRSDSVSVDPQESGPAPQRGCAGFRFLPGTVFTDGEFLYEVIYGCQGLGPNPAGWVAAARTDYIDRPDTAPERYAYSLFAWTGRAHDGVIIGGKRRPVILRLIKPAPRLDD